MPLLELVLVAAGFQFLCFVILVIFYCREAHRRTQLSKEITSLEQRLQTHADLLNSILDTWNAKFDPIELQTNTNSNLLNKVVITKTFNAKLQVLHQTLDSIVDFIHKHHNVPKETFAHWKHRIRTLVRGQSSASLDLMPDGILDGALLPCTPVDHPVGLQVYFDTDHSPFESASSSPIDPPVLQPSSSALPPELSRPDPHFWPVEVPELLPPPSTTPSPPASISGPDTARGSRRRRKPRRRAFDPRGTSTNDLRSFSPTTSDRQRPLSPEHRTHYDPTAPLPTRTITDPNGDTAAVVTLPFSHPAGHYCATASSTLPGSTNSTSEKKTLYIPRQ